MIDEQRVPLRQVVLAIGNVPAREKAPQLPDPLADGIPSQLPDLLAGGIALQPPDLLASGIPPQPLDPLASVIPSQPSDLLVSEKALQPEDPPRENALHLPDRFLEQLVQQVRTLAKALRKLLRANQLQGNRNRQPN